MTNPSKANSPALVWDVGTAYEFFVSLHVMHSPEYYGLRAPWAAGIRSRIPAVERKFLEDIKHFLGMPLGWVYGLPKPKDALSIFWALRQIPPEKRGWVLFDIEHWENEEIKDRIHTIADRRSWDKEDLAVLTTEMAKMGTDHKTDADEIKKILDWMAQPEELGDTLLTALQAYHQVFFEEEEKRVAPILQAGLEHAQDLAKRMSISDLIADLSQGVHYEAITSKELILVPAYWTTPLVVLEKISAEQNLFLYGARPLTMSATPGELVPDGMLRSLKALADPTRLKILYYLTQEEVTPSQLARRLHLRAPTVTHHLSELRLAGLVNLTIRGQEKLYRSRLEAIDDSCTSLKVFLQNPQKGGES